MDEYKEPVINAKLFASEFYELCKNFRAPIKTPDQIINKRIAMCNESIIDFLVRVKNCCNRGRCNMKTFNEQIIKFNRFKIFEIEIWWYLKKCGIMREQDFYRMFDCSDSQHITDYLSQCLCKGTFQEFPCSSFRKHMNSDLIKLILNHKDRCDNEKIDSIAYLNFLKTISISIVSNDKQNIESTNSVVEILTITLVKEKVIKSFLLDLIEILLQGEPMDLEVVMLKIANLLKNENLIVKNNLKLLDLLDSQDIIAHLKKILIQCCKPVHWQNVLHLLSCMASYFEDTSKDFKSLIIFLLDKAVKNLDKNLLLYAFILARYCSFLKMTNFPSYFNWFSSTFSSESSRPINTKEKSVFFMNFLNETAQFDAPYYLKVHINRAPYLPIECQSLLSDYVKLVKTRLIDLNETAELGLFDNISTKSSAEFDVETVLNIFSNTSEVPKCVLEASLFCRSYYEKKFLFHLLSKYEGKNSVRHRLITKLQSMGKIPNSLFLNYELLI